MQQWPRPEPGFPFAAWLMIHLLRQFAQSSGCFGNGSRCLGQTCPRLGIIVFAMRRCVGLDCDHCASCVLDRVIPTRRPIRREAPLDHSLEPRLYPLPPKGIPKVCCCVDFPFHPTDQSMDDPKMQLSLQSWSALQIAHRCGQPSGFRRALSPICANARSWISARFPEILVTDASVASRRYL